MHGGRRGENDEGRVRQMSPAATRTWGPRWWGPLRARRPGGSRRGDAPEDEGEEEEATADTFDNLAHLVTPAGEGGRREAAGEEQRPLPPALALKL